MNFLIFGDQSSETFEAIRNPKFLNPHVVQQFLSQVDTALRRQIHLLPRLERDLLPGILLSPEPFETFGKWPVEDPVLRPILTAISQFVEFFGYMDDVGNDVDFSKYHVLGLCTGLLPAAAVTAHTSHTKDLIPLALQIVCIALRIGVHTRLVATSLGVEASASESWSNVIQGRLEADVLAAFHDDTDPPNACRVYISAVTPTSTTISGPPPMLRKFHRSSNFRETGCSHVTIPVFGPYHAPHLHHSADIDWIIGADDFSVREILAHYESRSPLLSTKTGKPIEAPDMITLLRAVVNEILKDTLRWDILLHEVDGMTTSEARVIVIGHLGFGKSLVSRLHSRGRVLASLKSATESIVSVESGNGDPRVAQRSRIAIVGMAGRFPGAKDTRELWDVLAKGLDLHKEIPKDRFDVTTHVDPSGKTNNTSTTPYGCFIDEPGLFDPSFFRMSPHEASITDPMQRLALITAHEALEMAGFVPNRTPSSMLHRVGTFYGQTLDDYREVNASQKIDAFYVTGGLRPFGPGRIHYHYKFSGPSFIIDTACSSSLAAIQVACNSLWSGDCDTAIAGGMNIITGSDMYAGLSQGHFLSKAGPCKTFDDTADGYCRADAVGTIILKRLEDALADNDPVLGVILGSATNHSSLASSITQPHGPTQDTEMSSVSNVFAPVKSRKSENPLYVGSLKANIGHSEAGAGVTAVIKSLLMFQNQEIPPHIGIKGIINQKFPELDKRRIEIPRVVKSFQSSEDRTRLIFINNFGAAGGNSALLVEEPPRRMMPDSILHNSTHLIAISAKSPNSLRMNKERLRMYLENNLATSLADLSYTTTGRRAHYPYRFIAAVSNIHDLQEALMSVEEVAIMEKPKIVFAFTGQGGIYTGVGKELFATSRHFRKDILHFNSLAQTEGLASFLPLLDTTVDLKSLSTVQVQLGQVCVQMALYRLYRAWGVVPDRLIGHSLGEYAALYGCGVLTAADTILLVGRRAEMMEQHCTPDDLVCQTQTEIACINGPNDVVLSGSVKRIMLAASISSNMGISSVRLDMPYACHSSQLEPIIQPYKSLAKRVQFFPATIPLLSPLLEREIHIGETIDDEYLCRHLRERVDFLTALKSSSLIAAGENLQFLELGPHPICSGMIRNILNHSTAPSMRRGDDSWAVISTSLSLLYKRGLEIDWIEYNRDLASTRSVLDFPAYAFDEHNYWIEYKNDWTLHKGDTGDRLPDAGREKGPATASIQRLVRESRNSSTVMAEFESNLTDRALREVIKGHIINGVGLCQSSVYADMALTAAKYLYEQTMPDFTDLSMDVVDMEILAPVILDLSDGHEQQHIRITATLADGKVSIRFSDTGNGAPTPKLYAECTVLLRDACEILKQWRRSKHLVISRITHIKDMKNVNKLNRQMAYKIFATVVDYSENFHGIDEVFLHSEQFEAVARVSFKADESMGNFYRSPYWIDTLTQLSGFVMNANEVIDTKKAVYISNGWETMQFASSLSANKFYTIYVKMQPSLGSMYSGDLYVLDDEEIIGVSMGIRFQFVKREVLKFLLAPTSKMARESNLSTRNTQGAALYRAGSDSNSSFEMWDTTTSSSAKILDGCSEVARIESFEGPPLVNAVLDILCEQLGTTKQKLGKDVRFSDIGIDSLMSLMILGRLRESLGLDLSSTIFQRCNTVGEFVRFLEHGSQATSDIKSSRKLSASAESTRGHSSQSAAPAENVNQVRSAAEQPIATTFHHQATSVMLQGKKGTTKGILFLFPGGFGTASSFASMPNISQNITVFGLNSAFVNAPEDFTLKSGGDNFMVPTHF
ncbi:beta-ketoacyl synthase [Bisporella sp. PMI_857]|nr:beta-ketoacyl synthase [Bisporella sp. PMI_857]